MKVLIATRNKDKFKIVSELLSKTIFSQSEIYSLNDLKEKIIDKPENGDIIKRSYDKAKNVIEQLKSNEFDCIVGIDDGMKIHNEITPNVKMILSDIVNGNYLKEGEIIYDVRAYTFFTKDGKNKSIITEFPFKFKKSKKYIEIKPNSYPLSYVLTRIDSNIPISEDSAEIASEYYLKYSKKEYQKISELFNKYNNNR